MLSNAIKFTPSGGAICLSANVGHLDHGIFKMCEGREVKLPSTMPQDQEVGNHALMINVSDSGVGIEPSDLSRIFNPFEQVDGSSSRKFQGTGLGLSLSRKLVRLHGGDIWAESPGVGCGTTFRFIIPLEPSKLNGESHEQFN